MQLTRREAIRGPGPARLVFVGWGAIARRTHELLLERGSGSQLIAVGRRCTAAQPELHPAGCRTLVDPAELASVDADLVIEAAGHAAVPEWGAAALAAGMDFVPCSTGAFANTVVFDSLVDNARRGGGRILIPAGALAGLDGLAAASVLGVDTVTHTISKPPRAWRGTAAEELAELDRVQVPTVFFEGSAREAAARFPSNANAAMAIALSCAGIDRTRVVMIADPTAAMNSHTIAVEGAFGSLSVRIGNVPLESNPRSSAMTALSLVRLIENRSTIVVI